jgi:hypothetical protein
MQMNFPEVHESEYAWLDYKKDFVVLNNTGDLQNLYLQIRQRLLTNQ